MRDPTDNETDSFAREVSGFSDQTFDAILRTLKQVRGEFGTLELALAILSCKKGLAPELLRQAKITPKDVHRLPHSTLEYVDNPQMVGSLTSRATKVLRKAKTLARNQGTPFPSVEHLLFALLATGGTAFLELLKKKTSATQEIKERLGEWLGFGKNLKPRTLAYDLRDD